MAGIVFRGCAKQPTPDKKAKAQTLLQNATMQRRGGETLGATGAVVTQQAAGALSSCL